MNATQSIILGIIQGFTELLPISSSAHLVAIPYLLNWKEHETSFDIIIHSGTLLALIIYFRKDIFSIVKTIQSRKTQEVIINLALTTIPALLFGYIFNDFIERNLKGIPVIIIMLLVLGIALIFIDKLASENEGKYSDLNHKSAVFIGLCQILAFIRGCSRSGILIISGSIRGLNLKQAAKYSFLAGIPIIAAATIYQIFDFYQSGTSQIDTLNLVLGFFFSFITSLISIKFLFSILKRYGLIYFGYYRIIFALLLLFIYL